MKQQLEGWLRKDRRTAWLLLTIGLAGMLLIALGGRTPKPESPQTDAEPCRTYRQELEQRLTAMVEQIEGVGKASVVVTLEAGEEVVYATDESQNAAQHVLLSSGQGQSALPLLVYLPTVQGVVVVCQGGEDISVCARITEAVRVLTGVSANRISIAKMCE